MLHVTAAFAKIGSQCNVYGRDFQVLGKLAIHLLKDLGPNVTNAEGMTYCQWENVSRRLTLTEREICIKHLSMKDHPVYVQSE